MAFVQEQTRTAIAIADISIQLTDPDPTGAEVASAAYSAQVKMSDGSVVVRSGDLVPHISVAQRNALLNFMASLRTQAVDEFLPAA